MRRREAHRNTMDRATSMAATSRRGELASTLVAPHGGGGLRPLLLEGAALDAERRRARTLPRVARQFARARRPDHARHRRLHAARGFMSHADWHGVCDDMRSAERAVLADPDHAVHRRATAAAIGRGEDVALVDPDDGELLATMHVTEQYAIDKAHECRPSSAPTDPAHPGVTHGAGAARGQPRRPGEGAVARAGLPRSTARCS